MKKEIKLIAAIFNTKMEILLERYKDEYILPYGTLLKNERIEAAYDRFVLGKTGLNILLLNVVSAMNFDNENQISITYRCLVSRIIAPKIILPYQFDWYKKKDTHKLIMNVPYREVMWRAFSKY
jgi:ADP-ribose pyrophosphatase YjhB (NUDIX family)